jgi:hypothetical protein
VSEQLCDVVVVEVETGLVQSVVGENLRRTDGFHNAERRLETVVGRLNERYFASIVPAGQAKVGERLHAAPQRVGLDDIPLEPTE